MSEGTRFMNFPRKGNNNNKHIKVLFVKFSSLGDIIIHAHVGKMLKEMFPSFEITWLTEKKYVSLCEMMPWFDHVMSWDSTEENELSLIKRIRAGNFDMYFNLQNNDRSALLALMSGIRMKIGAHKHFQFIYNKNIYKVLLELGIPYTHSSDAPATLLRPEGASPIEPYLNTRRENVNIVFIIGASYKRKRWADENWIKLGRELIARGCTIFITGAGVEEEQSAQLIEKSCNSSNIVNLCGKLTFKELFQVLADSDFVISCDTGPLHMAHALGRKAIVMFGPTSLPIVYVKELGTAILTECEHMGCDNWSCTDLCMERIPFEDVLNSALKYIAEIREKRDVERNRDRNE